MGLATQNYNLPEIVGTSKINVPKDVNALATAVDTVIKQQVDTLETAVDGKAPTMHASSGTAYGVGSASQYGHVKISDAYDAPSDDTALSLNGAVAIQQAHDGDVEYLNGLIDDTNIKLDSIRTNQSVPITLLDNLEPVFSSLGAIYLYKELGIAIFRLCFRPTATIPAKTPLIKLGIHKAYDGNFQINFLYKYMSSANIYYCVNGYVDNDDNLCAYTQMVAGNVYIVDSVIPITNMGGDWIPQESTDVDEDRQAVVNQMKAWQGRFSYSQGSGRLTPETSGIADCSSTIYAAYKAAANMLLPTTGTPQMYSGAAVTDAAVGADLDCSNLQLGDIIGFSTNDGETFVHVVMYTGLVGGKHTAWEMNEWSTGANAGKKGPQPIDFTVNGNGTLENFRTNNYRKVVRYLF